MNTKVLSCADAEGHGKQQLRKQVRRRLTNRPYHERLMNMADARKEIATALKYHRATTKLAIEHQEQLQRHPQQHHSLSFQLPFYSRFSLDGRFKARRRPQINNTFDPPFYLENNTLDPTLLLDNNNTSNTTFLLDNNNALDPTLLFDNNILDVTHNILDATPVLNNNILDGTPVFNYNSTLEPTLFSTNNVLPLCSYSTSPPFLAQQDVPLIGTLQPPQGEAVSTMMNIFESSTTNQASGSMHVAMDERGMEEIGALGQQHQREWDDTTSMINSFWWQDCLQQMENSAVEVNNGDDTFHGIFDDQVQFSWEN
ncbi:uncharacterized protein LOC106763708 [Vigna radiata var. radiata]|uniref:Uncharacterized protein LOC106763708 n=1 Tax=Vigna radiata var. radiata TaxID=3916 RepID=A0A1S3UBG2_VIGRR|nr:uncharacterized protein LOC106763708 [Vigna radiata var. radiata]